MGFFWVHTGKALHLGLRALLIFYTLRTGFLLVNFSPCSLLLQEGNSELGAKGFFSCRKRSADKVGSIRIEGA